LLRRRRSRRCRCRSGGLRQNQNFVQVHNLKSGRTL
jgi:hypothetical protein